MRRSGHEHRTDALRGHRMRDVGQGPVAGHGRRGGRDRLRGLPIAGDVRCSLVTRLRRSPPSTSRVAPVMKLVAGLARNSTALSSSS